MESIYIICPREHIRLKENIYKTGRTGRDVLKRYSEYPIGSLIHFSMQVKDSKKIETIVLKEFKKLFVHKSEFGNEYFEGDINLMIKEIIKIISENDNYNDLEELKIEYVRLLASNDDLRLKYEQLLLTHEELKIKYEKISDDNLEITVPISNESDHILHKMIKRYSCNRCGFSSSTRAHVQAHLIKKKQCEGISELKVNDSENFKCEKCNEEVPYNIAKKHEKVCKKPKIIHTTIYTRELCL